MVATYNASLSKISDVNALEQEWLKLEERSDNRFFLSWSWIGTWLNTFAPNASILRVFADNTVIGLAIVTVSEQKRYRLLKSMQLSIHETGDPLFDQLWIEYNTFLTDSEFHEQCINTAIQFLLSNSIKWDELVIGAIKEQEADLFEQASGLYKHVRWESVSHGVNLSKIKELDKSYLATLSRNTRYQINRSRKLYDESGRLQIEHAKSITDAQQFLIDLAPLHIKRWGGGADESGFANPNFVAFHKALVDIAWPKGQIELIKITSGNEVVGYFYNFIYKNRVYFYLSALTSAANPKLKPGLMGHALCIQRYIDRGFEYYDFMGGGERYKDSLAQRQQKLYRISFQKPLAKFKIEAFARKIKTRLRSSKSLNA